MSLTVRPEEFHLLCQCIQDRIAPYMGRVEYGNLRSQVSDWDCGGGEPVTNIALVYETPGGSTDQINICFHHDTRSYRLIDQDQGEIQTFEVEVVLEMVLPRISCIPVKRLETLLEEIRRQIDAGSNTAGLFGHLNRLVQSEFRGGTITHLEMRDAMTYAVRYMNERKNGNGRT